MRIAIVDSGIELSHKRLKNCKVNGFSIHEEGNKIIYSNEFNDELGHGTGIAGIIHCIFQPGSSPPFNRKVCHLVKIK